MNSEVKEEWTPRRLAAVAVVLFVMSFLLMLFTGTLYENHEDPEWGQTAISVNIATAALLLFSLILSLLGRTKLSMTLLVVGIVGLAISFVAFGIKMMDKVWNH